MVASVNQVYLPYVVVDFGILSLSALLDSGATRSIINYDTFLKLCAHGLVKRTQDTSITCTTATSEEVAIVCCATVKIKIHRFSWYVPLLVSKNIGMRLILGADFIRKTGIILDICLLYTSPQELYIFWQSLLDFQIQKHTYFTSGYTHPSEDNLKLVSFCFLSQFLNYKLL